MCIYIYIYICIDMRPLRPLSVASSRGWEDVTWRKSCGDPIGSSVRIESSLKGYRFNSGGDHLSTGRITCLTLLV